MKEITKEEFDREVWLTHQYAPCVITHRFRQNKIPLNSPFYGMKSFFREDGLHVLFSVSDLHGDGKAWIHVSCAFSNHLPSYNDLCEVKSVFIGNDRQAIQVFPKKERHINIHKYALHLWAAIEGDGLPDFGAEGTI